VHLLHEVATQRDQHQHAEDAAEQGDQEQLHQVRRKPEDVEPMRGWTEMVRLLVRTHVTSQTPVEPGQWPQKIL
jgi:hypothetical protein